MPSPMVAYPSPPPTCWHLICPGCPGSMPPPTHVPRGLGQSAGVTHACPAFLGPLHAPGCSVVVAGHSPERLRSCRQRAERQRERRQDRTIANPPRDRGHLPRPRVAVAHPSGDHVKTCRTRSFRLRGRFCAGLRRVGSRDRGGVDRRGRIRRRATATGSRQQDQQRQAAPRRRNVPEAGRRLHRHIPPLSTRLPVPRGARIPMRGQPAEAGSPRTRIRCLPTRPARLLLTSDHRHPSATQYSSECFAVKMLFTLVRLFKSVVATSHFEDR